MAFLGGRSRRTETQTAPQSENISVSLVAQIKPIIHSDVDPAMVESLKRGDLAGRVKSLVGDYLRKQGIKLNMLEERNLVTVLVNELLDGAAGEQQPAQPGNAANGRNGATTRPTHAGAPHPQVNGRAHAAPTPVAPATPCPPKSPSGAGQISISPNGIETTQDSVPAANGAASAAEEPSTATSRDSINRALERVRPVLMERIDVAAAAKLSRGVLADEVAEICQEIMREEKLHLNSLEQRDLVTILVNDMLGLGPLEPLLADDAVTDILVNGPKQTYVERKGKLELSDVTFRDNAHVMQICTRIVSAIGRRVDESSPLCDARLADGSRVNIAIPPLALDGPSISIRKFAKQKITLDKMVSQGNISAAMATVLQIAGRARLNILISGGTGSGKTTLLNAMSRQIDSAERIVTIEDAAELQLQQPHVVRMETRPANLEGEGEVTMRDLVKNSLRMRPDRIILGEVRSSEAVDMLQAMNTGHEGSMCTIHANNPREALTRLENMIGMAGINLPSKAVRTQIASAVDMIIQVSRMRDGMRRITHIAEVVGMEGDIITTQELFTYKFEGEDNNGMLLGRFEASGLRPHFTEKAAYFGLDRPLMEAVG